MTKSATINARAKMNHEPTPEGNTAKFSGNTKMIIGASAAILLIGGLIIAAMPAPGTGKPESADSRSAGVGSSAGALSALETNFNFGSISMAAGKVTHRFWIRNTGTDQVLIRKMYTSCMCTSSTLFKGARKFGPYGMPGHGVIPTINEPVNAGEDAIVEVVFDPAAHGPAGIGPTDRVVTIENSAGRALELAFHANVTP